MNKLERIEALEAEIKKLKQELSEPEFEVGKWYKEKAKNKLLICIQDSKYLTGYGFTRQGDWSNNFNRQGDERLFIPATESEVFEALKKEAIKRGFKEGVKVDRSMFKNIKLPLCIYYEDFTSNSNEFNFSIEHNVLSIDGYGIFYNGKWAEIIDEPVKLCGYEVKKDGNYYEMGCKKFLREEIARLGDIMVFNNFKTVQFDEYKVTIEEINKILEL